MMPDVFLGFCTEFHDGKHNLTATIVVDAYKGNGNFDYNYETKVIDLPNDPHDEKWIIKVKVPEKGSYIISTTVTASECMTCENGESCEGYQGKPSWRGASDKLNQHPPPPTIQVIPELINVR